jgi:hypothetical protein
VVLTNLSVKFTTVFPFCLFQWGYLNTPVDSYSSHTTTQQQQLQEKLQQLEFPVEVQHFRKQEPGETLKATQQTLQLQMNAQKAEVSSAMEHEEEEL